LEKMHSSIVSVHSLLHQLKLQCENDCLLVQRVPQSVGTTIKYNRL